MHAEGAYEGHRNKPKEISTMTAQLYTVSALAAGTLFMIVALVTLGL